MGKRGPKKEPAAKKRAKGNPGKDRLPTKRSAPKTKLPQCPSFVPPMAKRIWKSVVPKLLELGVVAQVDEHAIAAYCIAFDRYRRANLHIKREGEFVTVGKNNYEQQNKWFQIEKRALMEMKSFWSSFGLTPSDRMALNIDAPDPRTPPGKAKPTKPDPHQTILDKLESTPPGARARA
jgi:P27 family predicted phage terminase small subunit